MPAFWIRHVLIKGSPGEKLVPSGIVISATKDALSVPDMLGVLVAKSAPDGVKVSVGDEGVFAGMFWVRVGIGVAACSVRRARAVCAAAV